VNNKEQLNILITGQNRGLGKALAERFSKDNKVLYHGGRKDFDLSSVSDIEKLGRYAKNTM
jgi:NAD(P)-dependent dehydrogenase (short-subunit alcohol dehydrogenase family)